MAKSVECFGVVSLLQFAFHMLGIGYWVLVVGYWLLGIGYWVLGVGYWLLAVGCWLLVIGCWVLVVGYWLLGVGCWLLGVGGWHGPCLWGHGSKINSFRGKLTTRLRVFTISFEICLLSCMAGSETRPVVLYLAWRVRTMAGAASNIMGGTLFVLWKPDGVRARDRLTQASIIR